MQDTTAITLPIPPDTFGILTLVVLLFLGSYVLFLMLPRTPDKDHKGPMQRMEESFGIKLESRLNAALLVVALFAYIMIFFAALLIAVRVLGGIVFSALPEVMAPTQPRVSLAFGTLIAAILGAPFIIWRTVIAGKQTAIAEESLFNDKINAAATDLAARRQVTRSVGQDGKEVVLTEWEDDLVTRAAAIDRLEGLALERADVAPRVARMLSIYVQELSRAHPAQDPPEDATPKDLSEWADKLTPIRPDMERAVQSLGRINPSDEDARTAFNPKNIDLRRCNLQSFDLRGLNFQGTQLGAAQMQGASLSRAQMQGANLGAAQMQGAVLIGAQMQGASLSRAQMQGADLSGAQMSKSTDLTSAFLRGVAVRSVDDTTIAQLQAHSDWSQMYQPDASINYSDFLTQWRAFAAALDPPVTIAPDYRP